MYLKSLVVIFLFCASLGQAQVVSGWGIKFGVVSSKLKAEGDATFIPKFYPAWENLNRRAGPQIGLFADFFKIPALGLQAEVSYLEKGAEDEILVSTPEQPEGTGETFTVDLFHHDFLAFSLLAQPRLKLGAVKPYAVIGPSLSLLIADRDGFLRDTKSLTPSLVAGAGVELLKPFAFPVFLEVRYNPDLDFFLDNKNAKFKFQLWQVLVGVNLRKS